MRKFVSTLFCEDKPLNEGFSNEEAVEYIANAGFDGVFMSLAIEHLSGGGVQAILTAYKRT